MSLRAIPACLGLTIATLIATDLPAGEPTANEAMVRAHQARAVWRDFPGFKAQVTMSADGQTQQGTVTVDSDLQVELDVPGEAFDWAERKLSSLAAHRAPNDETEYDVSYADEDTSHPLGRKIAFEGDRLHSVYRVRGDVITEVHRTMGDTRFTITVIDDYRNKEDQYLPRVYTVSYWNAKSGDLTKTDVVSLEWKRVGGFDLPARATTVSTSNDGRRQVLDIRLSQHKLLSAD